MRLLQISIHDSILYVYGLLWVLKQIDTTKIIILVRYSVVSLLMIKSL